MGEKKFSKSQGTQLDLLMAYFKQNPNRDISHPEIVDWATNKWKKQTVKPLET